MFARAAAAVVMFATLVACSPTSAPPPQPPAGNLSGYNPDAIRGAPDANKVLTVGVRNEPGSLTHLQTNANVSGNADIRTIFHAGLSVWDNQVQARPQLAALPSQDDGSMKVLADGTMEVVYTLRNDMTWSDGTPFTAHDMEFSWKMGADPQVPIAQRRVYQLPDKIEARDDSTLYTHWPEPFAFARTINAADIFPAPRHLLEPLYLTDKEAMQNHAWFADSFVGLGPYRLVRWERGGFMEFAARENYPLGTPQIGRLILRFIPDANTALTNLVSGTVDVAPLSAITVEQAVSAREQWEAQGKGKVYFTPTGLQRVYLQYRSPVLADVRMRQALLHGMDRKEIADTVMYGMVEVAHSFLHPRYAAFQRADPVIQKYPHDPQRASQLLSDLGWRKGADGMLVNATGEHLSLPWQFEAGDPATLNMATAVVAQWKQLGIDAPINALGRTVARDPETGATFSAISTAGGDSTIQNLRAWWHSSSIPRAETRWVGNNVSGWANPRADAIIDDVFRQLDENRQQELLADLAVLWAQDLPALPMWFSAETVAISSRVQGASPRPNSSGIFATFWNVKDWDLTS